MRQQWCEMFGKDNFIKRKTFYTGKSCHLATFSMVSSPAVLP